ncbi:MAG: hypothetical protein JWM25_1944 [Thermoleophilia bacterium]|nr:hypothetical protein [Thermoleophilia bacterium]MCZ4497359.1 hypothetical protein [Thermoleophilia bacterium]
MRVHAPQGSPTQPTACGSQPAAPTCAAPVPGSPHAMPPQADAGRPSCGPSHRLVVLGGGAAPTASAPCVDPELAALSQLFLAAALPERPPGRIQQLTQLLMTTMAKLAELVASTRQGAAAPAHVDASIAPLAPPVPAMAPQAMQPPPPPPVLFFAPPLGADATGPTSSGDGFHDGGGSGTGPSDASDGGGDPGMPSSWLPIPGILRLDRLATAGRDLVQRFDDLCDELGVTRVMLAACSLLAPLAAALLIQTASALLS